ncbi:MAG: hypothetical protein KVP17_005309 [Porospora cf. gigantea B]|uniref:uncharacterized protein n=1 Tax=Porospora cf. gigantea B TaxID=2853592 RepID=UPI003571A90A|nr:MAG: hypothetical protein KVP17_005309 [Porospora cf. gigantea B]
MNCTLIQRLITERPGKYKLSVSHTTREPREGEEEGVSYHFTTRDDFESLLASGGFVEYAEIANNLYGTSWSALKALAQDGSVAVIEIDIQGVRKIQNNSFFDRITRYVFVKPPSFEALKDRLESRGSENPTTLHRRLALGERELRDYSSLHWDLVFENNEVDAAYSQLTTFLGAEGLF